MPMKEGLHPSDIDRMVAAARLAIGMAMEARYEATEDTARRTAGHNAQHAHRVLHALQTLDTAFPREVSATAREARETRERQENAELMVAQPATTGDALDLRSLDYLDTPETRALLSALDTLLPLAEAVDKQRGHTLPESIKATPNETRGTDFAASVGELVLRLRGEIFGGNGRD